MGIFCDLYIHWCCICTLVLSLTCASVHKVAHNVQDSSSSYHKQYLTKCTFLHIASIWLMDQSWLSYDSSCDAITCCRRRFFVSLPFYFATFNTFYSFCELCMSFCTHSHAYNLSILPLASSELFTVFCCWVQSFPLRWTFKAFSRFWLYKLVLSWLLLLNVVRNGWQWEKRGKWKKMINKEMKEEKNYKEQPKSTATTKQYTRK